MTNAAAELKRKVQLILSQVRPDTPFYTFRTPHLAALAAIVLRDNDPPRIQAAGDVEVMHEQVVALKTLYAQSPPNLQKDFAALLMSQSTTANAAVIVHVIVEIGALPVLVDALKATNATDAAKRRLMWQSLREKLAHESHRFAEGDLTVIDEAREAELARVRVAEKAATAAKVRRLRPH